MGKRNPEYAGLVFRVLGAKISKASWAMYAVANRSCFAARDLESIFPTHMLKIVLQHGVIPGSCHTKAQGISSPGIDKGPPHGALQSWRAAMEHYVGLDVSLKLTAICIVDQTGKIEREGMVASNPDSSASTLTNIRRAVAVRSVVLERAATSHSAEVSFMH